MFFLWFFSAVSAHRMCLSAIVRDEERVIERFLRNNLYAFDRVDITDTGSQDATVDIAERFFASNQQNGSVHHFPWIDDFGKAKTYALEKSRENGCDHIVFLDADEEMWTSEMKILTPKDREIFFNYMDAVCPSVCNVQITSGGSKWWRSFSITGAMPWKFSGARHEFVDTQGAGMTTFVDDYFIYARRDQTRHNREKNSLLLDGLALERDAVRGINLGRSLYYAGQSYEQGGDLENALRMYRKRVDCEEGWYQEQFLAQLHAGIIVERTRGFNASMQEYFKAIEIDSTRAEPYYYLARGFRFSKNYVACYMMAREGVKKKPGKEHLFVNEEIFTISIFDEAAVCASFLPEYRVDSLEYFMYLSKRLPTDRRISDNLQWVNQTLNQSLRSASLPSSAARTKLLRLWKQ